MRHSEQMELSSQAAKEWDLDGCYRPAIDGVADLGHGDYGLDAGPFRDGRAYPLMSREAQE
jgi:hypothetical protein